MTFRCWADSGSRFQAGLVIFSSIWQTSSDVENGLYLDT